MEVLMDKVLMEQNSIQLYPNPAIDEVNVLYNVASDASNTMIEISDVAGRSIGKYAATTNNNLMKINTQSFKKGVYYVMLVVNGKNCKVEKLVIQ